MKSRHLMNNTHGPPCRCTPDSQAKHDGIGRHHEAPRVPRTFHDRRATEHWFAPVQETESVLRAEVLDLLGEQRFRREEPAEWCFVDGARTRLDEKAPKGTRSE